MVEQDKEVSAICLPAGAEDLTMNRMDRFFEKFMEMVERLEKHKVDFIQPVNTRFDGKPEVHRTLFFKDPSNNVLEFKYYTNSEMMY